MARGMEDLQFALTEIDAVAVLEPAGRLAAGIPAPGSKPLREPAGSARLAARNRAMYRSARMPGAEPSASDGWTSTSSKR